MPPVPAALAALLVLTAPLALAMPAAAAACTAPELVGATVAPATVVLGTAEPEGLVVTAQVRRNGCALTGVAADLTSPAGVTSALSMAQQQTVDEVTTYEVGVRVDAAGVTAADAGRWTSTVRLAWAGRQSVGAGPAFRLLRAARLTTNAAPEPVRRGSTVTVTGRLTRADWATRGYAGLGTRRLQLQFRPGGSSSYAVVRGATASRTGSIRTTTEATRDGCYRFVYAGSATTDRAVGTGDCVDVR